MKYVQCFYQYPVTFSSIGKTFPARGATGEMRNLAEVSDKELEKLRNREPFFRELVNLKKYRILNKMPENYKTSAARINEAASEIERLKAENEKLKAQIKSGDEGKQDEDEEDGGNTENTDLEKMEYKELQKLASDKGINPNQKKAKLIEELRAAE